MRWEGDGLAFLFERFARDPAGWMCEGSCGPVPNSVHGDQVVIDHFLREANTMPAFFQNACPGLLDFYDPTKRNQGPVVVFIGQSKPDTAAEPLRSLWAGCPTAWS